ncbi:hypothetical protein ASPZODRAFT_674018 [Penicilliopsis zonata CBS 506.65]|uniref:Major facilitator superfamily (MFS) profile domain-containing protein n=1 Tax=Penicilliopsis zonata CBS 506.65 TaxID=1073090 RepID=A0A1L9SD26_9EURO|nr:hypothetical protein ASPZODRAFT_674018 [Penicilliopsis zonata CBS 506.65]OJJ45069.1 hypothetical protein ASPZODRAFT_674018 [Penicilliopsis zonata CBS 506.65]
MSTSAPEKVSVEVVPQPVDDEKHGYVVGSVLGVVEDEKYPVPTEEESQTLRKIAANPPMIIFALCLVELAERASYYGASTVYSNFIEFPLPAGGSGTGAPPRGTQETAGALGMGLQASDALVLLFTFLAYLVPIFGGWWADVHIGKYMAIIIGVLICGVAHIIQIIGAIPSVLEKGKSNSFPPFLIGLLLLAFGAGVFKPNVAPVILEQLPSQKPYTKTLKSGEKVIVDPERTITRTMLLFYGFINIGAFYMLVTTIAEKYVGYWCAYLLAGCIYFILPIVLALIYKKTKRSPPSGSSELGKALNIIGRALRESKFQIWRKDFWDAAKPSVLARRGVTVDWSDQLVDDVRRTLVATEIFCYFPIWSVNDGGIGSVASNQGASMTTNGAPNDLLSNLNALAIIIAIPILSHVIYPFLNRHNMMPGRITRITFGFVLAAISGVCGAVVQYLVYKSSPCGYYASTCTVGVSPISIWWQVPMYVLGAWSECFANVTAYELAYSRAPKSMRGLVMALFLFNTALASALGEVLVPVTEDPYLIWIWAGPAIALAVQTVVFWFRFKSLNDDKYMTDDSSIQEREESDDVEMSASETVSVGAKN